MLEEQFYTRAGIEIKTEWKPFFCEVMLGNSFFFGFGIVGALTSGKISSLAVRDPLGAQRMFGRINRDFQFMMFKIIGRLPEGLKLSLFKALPDYYKYLKPLFGRMGEGIPGYPKDWIAEITGNDPDFI